MKNGINECDDKCRRKSKTLATISVLFCFCFSCWIPLIIMHLPESSKRWRDSLIREGIGAHHFAEFKQIALLLSRTNWLILMCNCSIGNEMGCFWFFVLLKIDSMSHCMSAKFTCRIDIVGEIQSNHHLHIKFNVESTRRHRNTCPCPELWWHCNSIFSLIVFNWSEFELKVLNVWNEISIIESLVYIKDGRVCMCVCSIEFN